MLVKFIRESALVQAFTDTRSGPERLAASRWATAATPDQIIVAHILQEYAKNPDNWTTSGTLPDSLSESKTSGSYEPVGYKRRDTTTWYPTHQNIFKMTDGKAVVSLLTFVKNKDGDGLAPWFQKHFFEVNKIRLCDSSSTQLFNTLQVLIEKKKQAEIAAAKALAELEESERKWNLAEDLLGMKRNEFGALVPKD